MKQGRRVIEGILWGAGLIGICFLYQAGFSVLAWLLVGGDFSWDLIWSRRGNFDSGNWGLPEFVITFAIAARGLIRFPIWPSYSSVFAVSPWKKGNPFPGGSYLFSPRLWAALLSASILGYFALETPPGNLFTRAFLTHGLVSCIFLLVGGRYWQTPYLLATAAGLYVLAAGSIPEGPWALLIAAVLYFLTGYLLLDSLEKDERRDFCSKRIVPPPLLLPAQHGPERQEIFRSTPGHGKWEWLFFSVTIGVAGTVYIFEAEIPAAIVFIMTIAITAFRTLSFIGVKLPPVTWVGRIVRGPLIFSRYDRIFLPPAAVGLLLAGLWFAPEVLPEAGLKIATAVSLTICLIITLKGFPSAEDWNLLTPGRPSWFPGTNCKALDYKAI